MQQLALRISKSFIIVPQTNTYGHSSITVKGSTDVFALR